MKTVELPPLSPAPLVLPGMDEAPDNVEKFLAQRGWFRASRNEWAKTGGDYGMGYTWEQAVAIETVMFLTLGGPMDAAQR